MAAGAHAGSVGFRIAPPGPLVAVVVDDEVEPAPRRLGREPLAAGEVRRAPGETPGTARPRGASHRQEVGPHPLEGLDPATAALLVEPGRLGHGVSVGGW